MNQVEGFVSIREPFSKQVSKARGITSSRISYDMSRRVLTTSRWTIDRTEFHELIVMTKDSSPGPDGIPYGAYWCGR